MTDATKITVYPPEPVAENSPVESVTIDKGDRVDWIYMSVCGVNYVYVYTVLKPVDTYQASQQIKAANRMVSK